MRPFHERRPTEDAAIGRAQQTARLVLPATVGQLRDRLHTAVRNDDGHGVKLLAARLVRVTA